MHRFLTRPDLVKLRPIVAFCCAAALLLARASAGTEGPSADHERGQAPGIEGYPVVPGIDRAGERLPVAPIKMINDKNCRR
jgi:hypothetical protein